MPSNVAAVVVHYKSHETLSLTVENLSQFFEPSRLFIIDNSSSLCESPLRRLATILDDGQNRGYAGGVNRGFQHVASIPSITEVLVCTHETIFRKGAVELLLETASRYPDGHIVAPKLVTNSASGGETIWSNGGTFSFPLNYPKHDTSKSRKGIRRVRWVDGAAFVMSTSTWRLVGGVPEEFFMYMEDVALGLKCQASRIPVLVNLDAVVEQTANGPSRSLAIRNRVILAKRYMGTWRRQVVMAEITVRSKLMALHPSDGVRSKSRESIAAVADAKSRIKDGFRDSQMLDDTKMIEGHL